MYSQYNQTDKCHQRTALGQTIKMSLSRHDIKLKKNSSKSQRKEVSDKSDRKVNNNIGILSRIGSSKKPSSILHSLKSRFDELVNNLFIKIDFDCTGYITYTKIGHCKEIPEASFYFFGGVFQKIKCLGAVKMKMFVSLCEDAYLQAKKEDIQDVFEASKQPGLKKKNCQRNILDNGRTVKFSFGATTASKSKSQPSSSRKSSRFSTKKVVHPPSAQKYTLKVQTEPSEDNNFASDKRQGFFKSQKKAKQHQTKPIQNELSLRNQQASYSQTQNISFQSTKLRILTERLDNQIQRNKKRIYTNKFTF